MEQIYKSLLALVIIMTGGVLQPLAVAIINLLTFSKLKENITWIPGKRKLVQTFRITKITG